MGFELRDEVAVLTGTVTVEEVEPLAAWLRQRPNGTIDLTDCTHLHTAALQALLFFLPQLAGEPADPFLVENVLPHCQRRLDPPE